MPQATDPRIQRFLHRLDTSVSAADVAQVTSGVKKDLEDVVARGELELPDPYNACCDESYARRLLHRDDELDYTVVVMTWGPGQGTQLHDHAGIWCVECVLQGELNVTQYDLLKQEGNRFRFESRGTVRAGVGQAGCLIPPYEYHVLGNALATRSTITLHVYGGDMKHCNLYHQDQNGWWQQTTKNLQYDN